MLDGYSQLLLTLSPTVTTFVIRLCSYVARYIANNMDLDQTQGSSLIMVHMVCF